MSTHEWELLFLQIFYFNSQSKMKLQDAFKIVTFEAKMEITYFFFLIRDSQLQSDGLIYKPLHFKGLWKEKVNLVNLVRVYLLFMSLITKEKKFCNSEFFKRSENFVRRSRNNQKCFLQKKSPTFFSVMKVFRNIYVFLSMCIYIYLIHIYQLGQTLGASVRQSNFQQ